MIRFNAEYAGELDCGHSNEVGDLIFRCENGDYCCRDCVRFTAKPYWGLHPEHYYQDNNHKAKWCDGTDMCHGTPGQPVTVPNELLDVIQNWEG